jgi:hypothetical protein
MHLVFHRNAVTQHYIYRQKPLFLEVNDLKYQKIREKRREKTPYIKEFHSTFPKTCYS